MIFDLISFLINLIIFCLFMIGIIYFLLFLMKERLMKLKRKREVQLIDKIQKKIKDILKGIYSFVIMLITMVFSVILAMGMKPIIYKLNYPLGEGYANFASYIMAICLYLLLSSKKSIVKPKRRKTSCRMKRMK